MVGTAKEALRRANTIKLCGWTMIEFDPDRYLLPVIDEIDKHLGEELLTIDAIGGFLQATHLRLTLKSIGPHLIIIVPLTSPPLHEVFMDDVKYHIVVLNRNLSRTQPLVIKNFSELRATIAALVPNN